MTFQPESSVILDDISLDIESKRVGLIGANGSGKSTLARIISGLIKSTTGNVIVHGVNPYHDRTATINNIGMIFQNPDRQIIFPTVEEELAFGLNQLKTDNNEAKERIDAILQRFNARDWARRNVYEMSDGQRHLVCLMAVLVMQPKTIIFDEPYSGLDLITTTRLHQLVAALDENVILITHDLSRLNQFDEVIWLHEGRIIETGTPAKVITAYEAFAKNEINH